MKGKGLGKGIKGKGKGYPFQSFNSMAWQEPSYAPQWPNDQFGFQYTGGLLCSLLPNGSASIGVDCHEGSNHSARIDATHGWQTVTKPSKPRTAAQEFPTMVGNAFQALTEADRDSESVGGARISQATDSYASSGRFGSTLLYSSTDPNSQVHPAPAAQSPSEKHSAVGATALCHHPHNGTGKTTVVDEAVCGYLAAP